MSQTLAHLIKNKIFQGASPTGDEKKKRSRRWGHRKGDSAEDNLQASPSKQAEAGLQFPMSPLNSIGEESRSIGSESESELEGISEFEEEGIIETDGVPCEEEDTASDSPVGSSDSERRQGKLHLLKSKMSIPDLSFKPHKLHNHHARQKSIERSPTLSKANSPHSVPMSPGSIARDLPLQRPPNERSASGLGSIYKLGSNSSTSSSRFFYSPRRSANNISNLTSSNNGTQISVVSKTNSGINLFGTNSSTQLMRGHVRNSSVEMKSVKPQPLSIGRRRSKTLDTYGDYKKGWDTSGDLLSTINAHLSSSRSNSIKSRSPSLKTQESISGSATTVAGETPLDPSSPGPAPPRFSNGGGSIPFPSAPVQPQATTSSRRGSSIANAFNSFVNLRSFSNTSSKGTPTTNASRVEVTEGDLSNAPEPEAEEGYDEYLAKLAPYGKGIAAILCEEDDAFKRACLSHFLMNHFDFSQCPLDIALRIMLIFLQLPKEAQQIDRLLIEFGKIYYKVQSEKEVGCLWVDESQVYFVTFSLLMLHTDYFNPKNRFKMTKQEFISLVHEDKESHGCKVPREILSYFYDNITAKEFTNFDIVPQGVNSSSCASPEPERELGGGKVIKFYSPVDIIRTQASPSNSDFVPLATTQTGRASSNSFSSYLPHVPVSTSSSSLSLVQDDVDVYSHIFDDSLSSLSLTPVVQKVWDEDYLYELFANQNKYNKYFSILKGAKGGYLRLSRQDLHKLAFQGYEVLNMCESDLDNLHLKIIQMGEIDELTLNRKFTIVGAANKTMWKRQLGILTTCGLLMFDSLNWVNPRLVKDESTGTSNYIIDYHSSASMTVESPIPVRGLLAVNKTHKLLKQALDRVEAIEEENESRTNSLTNVAHADDQFKEPNGDCIMRLYGSQKAKVWRCSSQYEKENWIDAINLMAAHDGCYIHSDAIENTVVSSRKHSIKQRINKLKSTGLEKQHKLEESEKLLDVYAQMMPICIRTKNELSFHIKQLAVTMEWLVYEIKRSEINLKIIEQVDTQYCGKRDHDGCGQEEDKRDDYTHHEQGEQGEQANEKGKGKERDKRRQSHHSDEPEGEDSMTTGQPFIFDEQLMHRNFVDEQSVIYDQTEVNSGGILASY
ncbi:SYT1 (YPR095C) [Zygosaccharomyces parabailii]|nr:SYT1 (YPR095C) [Zygosaccharomyces parabailii]